MKPSPRLLKFLRRALLALAIAATLLAAFVIEENWRGDRAWAAVERDLRARGEPLDFAAFATPPIPDERNLFKAPALADLFLAYNSDLNLGGIRASNEPQKKALSTAAQISNMVATSTNYEPDGRLRGRIKPESIVTTPGDPTGDLHLAQTKLLQAKLIVGPLSTEPAEDILIAMKPVETLLDAVCQAARERPDAWLSMQLPTDEPSLDAGFLLELGRSLGTRATAKLALGRTDEAFADLAGLLALARATRTGGPILFPLVGEAMRESAADAIKAGCRRHLWTDAQLVLFGVSLADFQPFAQFKKSLQFERVWMVQSIDSPPRKLAHGEMGLTLPRWLFHGWVQQNKVSGSHALDEELASFEASTGRVFADRVLNLRQTSVALHKSRSPYVWVTAKMVLNIGQIISGLGVSENHLREAVAACALERHRLTHGSYPATLAELVPAFIAAVPADVFSGQPLGYTRTPDGGFKLTSLADDGKSEGKVWTQPGGSP
ncbi:MAG: hypothetical protein WCL04_04335 [Verrucomicrobiota bacterium]